jgi:ribosomal protein S18 acetylase RimI-like enzyme
MKASNSPRMTDSRRPFLIRPAMRRDASAILEMLVGLASFEGAENPPRLDSAALRRDVFGPAPRLHIVVAELTTGTSTRELAGFVSWFENYSSWVGRAGIHIGDLWIRPEHRGQGIATALFENVFAPFAGERVDVFVIRTNQKARTFYEGRGFQEQKEWCLYRVESHD